MDEPTASLSGKEATILFSIIHKLRDQGVSIIYISHRLEEDVYKRQKYGSVRHSGFGLGFERCVMYLTGMGNIRDVIPFPRTVNNLSLIHI